MTRRPTATPANPHGSRTGSRRNGRRPRSQTNASQPLGDALELPEELRRASGLTRAILRRLRAHQSTRTFADPKTGQVYSARLNPIGHVCKDGYVRLGGGRNWAGKEQYAHRIVWQAVNGPIPDGYQIDHRNHCKSDNRASNLQALTPLQNVQASVRRGRIANGENVANARLNDQLVREIRATTGTVSGAEWARQLGLDRTTINCARRGQSWRHVKPCPRLSTKRRPRSR